MISNLLISLSISIGLGVTDTIKHNRENPVAIVEIEQRIDERWSVNFSHTSSLIETDDDYGINLFYIKARVK